MTLLRHLALFCLLLTGLAGCTEGQKSNPLPRAADTAQTRPSADFQHVPIAAPDAERKAPGSRRDSSEPARRTFNPDSDTK
jgi:hypothetical protein